ncbi:MAG: YggT family protein [Chloroflexi bacterium]|nr:YggT family protein [Chloroflexota bacterium]
MDIFSNFVSLLVQALTIAIVARALLSWFPGAPRPIMVFLYQITEPILAPLRRVVPRIGLIDITPIIAIFLLQLIAQLLVTR